MRKLAEKGWYHLVTLVGTEAKEDTGENKKKYTKFYYNNIHTKSNVEKKVIPVNDTRSQDMSQLISLRYNIVAETDSKSATAVIKVHDTEKGNGPDAFKTYKINYSTKSPQIVKIPLDAGDEETIFVEFTLLWLDSKAPDVVEDLYEQLEEKFKIRVHNTYGFSSKQSSLDAIDMVK